MAKFKYYQNLEVALGVFQTDFDLDVSNNGTKAVWEFESGAEVTFEGEGLKGSANGLLKAGQINSIKIVDSDQQNALTVTDLNIKATRAMDALLDGEGAEELLFFLTKGDDRAIGHGGQDTVFSGNGDDVLTGKGGSDLFYFQKYEPEEARAKSGPEHDVITDFDTNGDDVDQLYIQQDFDYKKANKGADTLLTFEDGSTLLLEDVKRSEFKEYWESISIT